MNEAVISVFHRLKLGKAVCTWLENASRTPVLGVTLVSALALLFAVYPALPIGGELLDSRSDYTYQEAVAAMEGYGEEGRRVYAWSSAILDTVLIVVYVSFLAGLIYRLRPAERLWRLAYLPLVAGALDLGENIQIVLMLIQYPDVSAGQVAAASSLTLSKALAILSCLALAGIIVAVWVVRRALRGLRAGA